MRIFSSWKRYNRTPSGQERTAAGFSAQGALRGRQRILRGGILFLFLCCGLVHGGTLQAYADETEGSSVAAVDSAYGYRNSPVAMEASYGYDNMAKGGRYLPIYVTLTNQLTEPFSGKVLVKSMESDFKIYQYEYPVSLAGEETMQINLNVPLGLRADQLYVYLQDADGEEIMQKRLKINIRQDTPELLIGVLSDSQGQLEYLNGVGIQHSTLLTRTCAMVAGSIPEQAAGLDQLDVLLITNYDIRRLNSSQIDTINEWVSRGGVLLLGTGAGGEEAAEMFLADNLAEPLPDSQERTVNMGDELAIYGPSDAELVLDTTLVKIRDGQVVLSSGGMPVLTAVNREKGMVAVAAYDFTDIGEFCQDHPYVDKLFTSLLGEDRIRQLAEYLYDGGNSNYLEVQSLINSGSVENLPAVSLYVIVIAGYILLAGPGLYFFLKHRQAGRFYGRSVVILSVCCGMFVYLMGSETRFDDTFFNYASIRDYSGGTVVESTYLNIRAPYNRPYSASIDPTYDIRPITRTTSYDRSQLARYFGEERANITVSYDEDATRMSVWNIPAFSPNYFRLEKREQNENGSGFSGQITCFDGKISGSITNQLGRDVERVGVLCSGSMVVIDSMKDGETVLLDNLPVLHYPVGNTFVTADRVSGGYRFPTADIASAVYMESLARTNLLSFYLKNFLSGYQYEARVVAFDDGSGMEKGGFLLEEGYEVDGLTMYTASVEAKHEENGQICRTSLERLPEEVSGSYSADSNTMDSSAPLTLEYSFGGDMDIERLTLIELSEEFTGNTKYGVLPVFDGDIYFYNYETGNFDQMEWGKKEFNVWQLEPYLNEENILTVKYVSGSSAEYMPEVSLPILSAVGRETDA